MKRTFFLSFALMIFVALFCLSQPVSSDSDWQIVNIPVNESPQTKIRLYKDMSEGEKIQFVSQEADKILKLIGNGSESEITPDGKAAIKTFVDGYAKRQNSVEKPTESCTTETFGRSSLSAILQQGKKAVPYIITSFTDEEISPHVGIYTAMIESEFCPCIQSPTGAVGVFQFLKTIGKEYGLKVSENTADSVNESDERCQYEPASRAGAVYFRKLTTKVFPNEANRITFAIASWNAGEGSVKRNIRTVSETTVEKPISFWLLMKNKEQLTAQFKTENIKYVPKFFAAAIVGENPTVFGIESQALSQLRTLARPNTNKISSSDNRSSSSDKVFWETQRNKALEKRNADVGSDVPGLFVPAELKNNGFGNQIRKVNELNLQLPKDWATLAEMLQNRKFVEVPLVTENYFLDVGGSATDEPFTILNRETNQKTALEPSRLIALQRFANDSEGPKFNLKNPVDRKQLRIRLLQVLLPEAKTVLEEIALAYRARYERPLRVTALIRPVEYQIELSKTNPNLSRSSTPPHSTGLAFDLAYSHLTAEEQNFLMQRLAKMERDGKAETLRESDGILHVFVYPDGKPPKL